MACFAKSGNRCYFKAVQSTPHSRNTNFLVAAAYCRSLQSQPPVLALEDAWQPTVESLVINLQ